MPPALVRRRSDLDVYDLDAVRRAMLGEVELDLRLRGEPIPRIVLLGDGFRETLMLTELSQRAPDAHSGATFRMLAARDGVEHRFLIARLQFEDGEGRARKAAVVICEHPGEDEENERLLAILQYEQDPVSHLGVLAPQWQIGDTASLAHLYAPMRAFVEADPGARPGLVVPSGPPEPNIRMTFGELHDHVPLPEDPLKLAHLALSLSVEHILREGPDGPQVLRLRGRSWEVWLLGPELPTDLDDMVRVVAHREPAADAVAVLQIVLYPGSGPPRPGIQVLAELGGQRGELFAFLELSDGLRGPKQLGRVVGRPNKPPAEGEGWLGVAPLVFFELGPTAPDV